MTPPIRWPTLGWSLAGSRTLEYATPDQAWRVRAVIAHAERPVLVRGYAGTTKHPVVELEVETPKRFAECHADTYGWLVRHRAWQIDPVRFPRPAAPPDPKSPTMAAALPVAADPADSAGDDDEVFA